MTERRQMGVSDGARHRTTRVAMALAVLVACVALVAGPTAAGAEEVEPGWTGDDGVVPGEPLGPRPPATRGAITLPDTGPLPITVQEASACRSGAQPGLIRLRDFLLDRFPGSASLGIYNCRLIAGSSVLSLHGEGRALDIRSADDAMRLAMARCVLLNAGPLQLQRIIDEDTAAPQIWSANTGTWRAYGGGRVPQNLHLERNWAGAADDRPITSIPGFDLSHCPRGPVSTPTSADADAPALTTDAAGNLTIALLKTDGSLWTRTFDATRGWQAFVRHDVGVPWSTQAKVGLTAASDGRVWLYAVDATGVLWARRARGSTWSTFTSMGGGWSIDAGVSAAAGPNGYATFGAVKTNGVAYTKSWNGTTWLPADVHPGTWTTLTPPTLLRANDRALWLLGIQADGSLWTRRQAGSTWGGLQGHGAGWAPNASVGATARAGALISLVATRADGSLQTRTWGGTSWNLMVSRGSSTSWSVNAGASFATGTDGKLWIVAVQADGTMLSQYYPTSTGGWSGYTVHGSTRQWSTRVGPTLVARPQNRLTFLSVAAGGTAFTHSATGTTWSVVTQHGTTGSWVR